MRTLAHTPQQYPAWEDLSPTTRARLNAGTVTKTRHGWRVECRAEFNDDRVAARAYWPKPEGAGYRCMCRHWKMSGGFDGGTCTHIEAVLYRIGEELRLQNLYGSAA